MIRRCSDYLSAFLALILSPTATTINPKNPNTQSQANRSPMVEYNVRRIPLLAVWVLAKPNMKIGPIITAIPLLEKGSILLHLENINTPKPRKNQRTGRYLGFAIGELLIYLMTSCPG